MGQQFTGVRIQEQTAVFVVAIKVEHTFQRAGDLVEGIVADTPQVPVVFHETENRRLISDAVVNEVFLCPRRYNQQWQARTVAAAILMSDAAGNTAAAVVHQTIMHGVAGLTDDGWHDVIIPTIGVIVSYNHCGFLPLVGLLQAVDGLYNEGLLIQRIGVSRVSILISGGLQEAHRRKIAGVHCRPEVFQIVLVIGLVLMADHIH